MSRTRREKNPGLKCDYRWGETPGLLPTDFGWQCPHVCSLALDHDTDHFCCPTSTGRLPRED